MLHTNGPWEIFGEDENNAGELLPPADGKTEGSGWPYVIASPDRGIGYNRLHIARGIQGEADARLIAAAPDMLAALKRVLDHHENGGTLDRWFEITRDVRAAIAKTEG